MFTLSIASQRLSLVSLTALGVPSGISQLDTSSILSYIKDLNSYLSANPIEVFEKAFISESISSIIFYTLVKYYDLVFTDYIYKL